MTEPEFSRAYRTFLALFNEGAYWDSHEALEAAWRATGSDFYQGLILFASAWVHVGRRNTHGIRAQLGKAEERLAPFRPSYLGLDVDRLFASCAGARRAVQQGTWPQAPRLTFDPALVRGDEPELRAPLEPPPPRA